MIDLNNALFLRALRRESIDRTPIWLMRQAGRYLPEYRKIRAQAGSFLNLCQNKELACEVTLQPLRRYALDAAILFSDILTIPDAMGLGLYFIEGEGPCFKKPLHSVHAIEKLTVPHIQSELEYVMEATKLIRQELPNDMPLIGFSGSPWTLACYMVEGKSSKQFQRLTSLVKESPEVAHLLLEKLTLAVSDYLYYQVQAGANALMIFDTWGGLLSTSDYELFSLNYMQEIVAKLASQCPATPIILFTKNASQWLKLIANTGCHGVSVDWTCNLLEAREEVGNRVALQGNLNPAILLKDKATIREHVQIILADYGYGSGHIFNLGHGITPDVPPENVAVLVDAVREFSPFYHQCFKKPL